MAGRLDRDEVRRIARLARLELSEEEIGRLSRELASVLAQFEAIDAVGEGGEARGEEILNRGLAPRLGEDAPPPDPLLRGPERMAPEWQDGFFLVPRLSALDRPREGDGAGAAETMAESSRPDKRVP